MGVTALLYQISSDTFKKLQESQLYTTWALVEKNPSMTEDDIYVEENPLLNIDRSWSEIDYVFQSKGEPLRHIIMGDYQHPDGIEPGGEHHEGIVSPQIVKKITPLLDSFSREWIIDELGKQGPEFYSYSIDDAYSIRVLNHFEKVFNLYRRAAQNNNAIVILYA